VEAGLTEIEVTSFVSPKWVPQMADAAELFSRLPAGPEYSALVPNQRGFESAMAAGVGKIALFTAVSDAFTQRNINRTVAESLVDFRAILAQRPADLKVRGYVSTAFRCPFAGETDPGAVRAVVDELVAMGCDEVSIGDTIGTATPRQTKALASHLTDVPNLFWHFHDTYGRAIANVMAALESGVGVGFDASAGGLGGCPYAPGATGNLATEDLVCLLEAEGVDTSVNSELLARASLEVFSTLGRPATAKAQRSLLARS